MKILLIAVAAISLTLVACMPEGYQFGDISKKYCSSTDPQVRAAARVLAESKGLTLPAYCEMLGLEYKPDEQL